MSSLGQPPSLLMTFIKYSFYTSVVLFVLFGILLILHFTFFDIFSFVTGDNGLIPIPSPSTAQTMFTTATATSDISCNFTNVTSDSYTIMFDVYMKGDFYTTNIPRILLYRSDVPLTLKSTDTLDVLTTTFNNSNIIIYLDPTTNDLYVSVLDTTNNRIRSEPITNVPLRTPFRIIVVFSHTFIEIYLAGDLIKVMPFSAGAATIANKTYFFGPPSLVNQSNKIARITYWNSELTSKVVRMFGKQVITTSPFY